MSSRISPRLPLHPYSQACSSSSALFTSDCPLPEEDINGFTTQGKPILAAALKNAQDSKREWLAAALEDGYEIPEPTSDDEYSGQFKLRLPKSLHRALAENSKREGISMNQYCLYLLTKNNAEFRHGA